MSIFSKIKLFFRVKKEVKKVREVAMTKGVKTSEFWLTLAGSVSAIYFAVQGLIPADLAAKIVAGAVAVYTIARAVVKVTPGKKDDELLDKIAEIVKPK